jgi:hypothetical protein
LSSMNPATSVTTLLIIATLTGLVLISESQGKKNQRRSVGYLGETY